MAHITGLQTTKNKDKEIIIDGERAGRAGRLAGGGGGLGFRRWRAVNKAAT